MDAHEYEAIAGILEQAARAFRQLAASRPVAPAATPVPLPGRLALSVREVADELGVSRSSVYGLIQSGNLPSLKIGSRRMVSRSGLAEWLAAQG